MKMKKIILTITTGLFAVAATAAMAGKAGDSLDRSDKMDISSFASKQATATTGAEKKSTSTLPSSLKKDTTEKPFDFSPAKPNGTAPTADRTDKLLGKK